MKRHGQRPRQMVVTSARGSQPAGRIRYKLAARGAGEDAQSLQKFANDGPIQTVVAMLSLGQHLNQTRGLQTIQVCASRGWIYARDDGKLSAGSRPAIQQAVQHARSRRLANRRSNP
jgi:hypothetical protein